MEYFLPPFLQRTISRRKKERLSITDSFYEGGSKLLHTQAAGHNPLINHYYLDPIRLQKSPEAHFIQSSRVRHSSIANYGVSQGKNLPFVAGICQGFGVPRWRNSRNTSVWSQKENKRPSENKTGLNSYMTNGIHVKIFSEKKANTSVKTPWLCHLWLNIWHGEQVKTLASHVLFKKSTEALNKLRVLWLNMRNKCREGREISALHSVSLDPVMQLGLAYPWAHPAVLCPCCCKSFPFSLASENSSWKASTQQSCLPRLCPFHTLELERFGMFRVVAALLWGGHRQGLGIPHHFSPTCSVNKPCHGPMSVVSPSRGLASLLGNLHAPTHRTPLISPDKCLGAGLCMPEEGQLETVLWDSACQPWSQGPRPCPIISPGRSLAVC